MLQHADHPSLLTSLPTVEEVLDNHAPELGHDLTAYRNHVYRVVNLSVAIVGDTRIELEKIAIAAVFHDLGIWTNKTFDYIAPSVALAREHLAAVVATWPNAGFHRRLLELTIDRFLKHPLTPLPMVKW
jgi:HD superfamily phosphodiesterase